MNQTNARLATLLICLAGCFSQTPIGSVDIDAAKSPDADSQSTLSDAHPAALDGQMISKDTQEIADTSIKVPPPGPPTQTLATRNSNGTYSCSQVVGDQYAGCPTEITQENMRCDLPAGTVCDIPAPDLSNYTICTCNSAGKYNAFSCYGIGGVRSDCPRTMPVHGSPCTMAQRGLDCSGYIKPLACTCAGDLPNSDKQRLIGCTCDNNTQTWRCKSAATSDSTNFDLAQCHKQPSVLPPGPTIETAKKLSALSTDEVESFCAWAVETQRAGGSPPLPNPAIVNGTWGDGFGYTACSSPVNLCLPLVPANICKRLLTRKPCGATVQELADCIFTGMSSCQVVGNGCGPLNADPNCSETIVQLGSSVRPAGVGPCAVPLD